MIRPPKLRPGDKVGIISTARKISPEDLLKCFEWFANLGLNPVQGEHLFSEDHQYAGIDNARLEDLQRMIDNPEIKAIFCARGGYGTLRIIDDVNWDSLKTHPKWIIGFSDVTPMLLNSFNLGMESIHGPMGISFDGKTGDATSFRHLENILLGHDSEIVYSYTPTNQDLVRPGMITAPVIGGNLTMLSHCIGTPIDLNSKECILFFEDLDEYLYNIDRLTLHLKRSGKFENIKGLIVGGMTDLNDNSVPFGKTGEEIVYDHAKEYDFPLCFGFPVGHWPQNYPIVVGREATLKVTHTGVEFSFDNT